MREILTDPGPESTACDKSFSRGCWRSRCDGGPLRRGQSADFPKGCALCLLSALRIRTGEGGGAALLASSDHDKFLPGVGRQCPQRFLSSVLQYQGNRLTKIR